MASKTNKRTNSQSIIDKLPGLQRSTLEEVAEAALRSSSAAVSAAEKVLHKKKKILKHCLRCHNDFDPSVAGSYDCTMEDHDENNGMIESGGSGRCWLYPCCLKSERSGEPCWIGSHVTEWSEFSTKEKEHECNEADDENYWRDRELALTWRRGGRDAATGCFECRYGDGFCSTCCTCGEAHSSGDSDGDY